MKKLNVILHETTIINFPFFWKLIKRYKWFSLLIPICVFSYGTYFYLSQNDIYLRKKYFKNRAAETDSPTSAIASVLGEKTSSLTESEIIGVTKSLDFQQEFTTRIFGMEEITKLDFGGLNSQKDFSLDEFLSNCAGERKCIINKLRGQIFSFISVHAHLQESKKYYVEVKTRDPFTTKFLLHTTSRMITESRVNTIKHKIEEQIKISKELADTKREELASVDVKALKQKKRFLEGRLTEVNRKIQSYDSFFQRMKLNLSLIETQVDETKKATKRRVGTDKLLVYQKRQRLEKRIKQYERDIAVIKGVNGKLSADDNIILKQLMNELADAKAELKSLGDEGRRVTSVANFIEKKEGQSDFTEFDYRVQKKQVVKAREEYQKIEGRRDDILQELSDLETKLEEIKPSFEYLQLLEQKMLQLTLLNSTVVSDLVFENQLSPQRVFKKTGKSKVILFSVSMSFVFLTLVIFGFYLMDDRIYDQTELEKSFEDLTIIGNTPEFD